MKKTTLFLIVLMGLYQIPLKAQQFKASFLEGVWESTNAAPRAVFENGRVIYTEAEPILYKVEGNKIMYSNGEENLIIRLNFNEFVEKSKTLGTIKWTRIVEIPPNYTQLLQSNWKYQPPNMGMPSILNFKGNKVSMGMMGYYSFKLRGKVLYYTNIKDGADFSQKVVQITKDRLVLLSADQSEVEVYKKK
ncbi:hypothetical protein BKI52_41885 [marine bacterium AO1-C]|nr:hypothetical protein BKI52_41885 [marine bacterium AO1-C]